MINVAKIQYNMLPHIYSITVIKEWQQTETLLFTFNVFVSSEHHK